MRLYFLLLSLFVTCGLFAQETRKLSWDDLLPKESAAFDDPFKKLTAEQLQNLSLIARIETLEEHKPKAVDKSQKLERDSLRILLAQQNVPVDSLFAIRFEIADKRRKRAEATNPELDGIKAKIPGYLLPLDYSNKLVTEFLLVPWVGACIHTPPPPKNQIVHVILNEGYEVKSNFEAVWIVGEMSTTEKTSELYLVDGSDDIFSGYSVSDALVEPFTR